MGEKSSRPSREVSKQFKKENNVEIQTMDELHNAYRNGWKVNPIDFIMLDNELRDEYEEEFGQDSRDTNYDYYEHEEQIERYTKNLLFWIRHQPNVGSKSFMEIDSKTQAKLIYVTDKMSQLRRKILQLRPELQKAIHERLKELPRDK